MTAKEPLIEDRQKLLPRDARDLRRPLLVGLQVALTAPTEDLNTPEEEVWSSTKRLRIRKILTSAKTRVKSNEGLLLIASSQAFFSLMNVAVKKLNSIDPPVSALQLILVRMAITWLCCVTYMAIAKVPDPILGPKGVRLLLAFRGFSGFFGLFGIYYSLQYLSLSDATVLTFLVPMTTAVSGALVLGERFSWKQAAAGLVSLIGVILIARPDSIFGRPELLAAHRNSDVTSAQRMVAIGVAMLGVLGATGAYTSIRAIGKRAHPLHALTSFSIQSVIVASITMIIAQKPVVVPTELEWVGMFIMIGIFGFFAQVLLTLGLQRETASRGSMAIYTQIVFATIFERIFFGALPTLLSAFGTLLIVSSAIYVALSKESPRDSLAPDATRLHRVSEDSALQQRLLSDTEYDGDEYLSETSSKEEERALRQRENLSDEIDWEENQDIVLPLHSQPSGASTTHH